MFKFPRLSNGEGGEILNGLKFADVFAEVLEQIEGQYILFLYKNILYKNIEVEIGQILRIF